MFANRFTALLDACVLVSALKRNLLLSLAEAEFFRLRWSSRILDEAEQAIAKLLVERGIGDGVVRAARAREAMERAFEEAMVTDYEELIGSARNLPDPDDRHVVAAAMKARASLIVTDNIKHFPRAVLNSLDLEAKSADAFIADTLDLDTGRAVSALRRMRERFKRPEKTAELLLLDMEAAGLTQTVDLLRDHVRSL